MTANQQPSLDHSKEIGYVQSARDYLLTIQGLPTVRINDVITTKKGSRAIVTGLDSDRIEAMMLDPEAPKPGTMFTRFMHGLSIPLGDVLLGRAITPLGSAFDGKEPIDAANFKKIEMDVVAPGVSCRKPISELLFTGMTLVDLVIPIAKGQRELIIGDPRSNIPTFLLNTIKGQKGKNMTCIYVCLGKGDADLRRMMRELESVGAISYTVIIAAPSSMAAPLISIAVGVSSAIADSFKNQGKDVLLIWHDLGAHAKYLREIALLSGRVPGRESYPADIFYQHSQFIERAGNFNDKAGSGSITLLPVIETGIENITSLIPANIMSATDGHMLFTSDLASQGKFPAVNQSYSVTRIGHATQPFIFKVMAEKVRQILAEYEEIKKFSLFGAELSEETRHLILTAQIISELLDQEELETIDPYVEISLIGLAFTSFLTVRGLGWVRENKHKLTEVIRKQREFQEITTMFDSTDFHAFTEMLEAKSGFLDEQLKSGSQMNGVPNAGPVMKVEER